MEPPPQSSSLSLSVLRHRLLRATVCCFVGVGSGGLLVGERMRWRRRRAGAGEFRYDPLSYALNFDQGGGGDEDDHAAGARLDVFGLSSHLTRGPAGAAAAVEAA